MLFGSVRKCALHQEGRGAVAGGVHLMSCLLVPCAAVPGGRAGPTAYPRRATRGAETRRNETRAEQEGGGGTHGRSLSRADRAPLAHVRDVDDGSGIISDSEPVREFGPSLILFFNNMFLFRTKKKLHN